jgi:hypothetical protein
VTGETLRCTRNGDHWSWPAEGDNMHQDAAQGIRWNDHGRISVYDTDMNEGEPLTWSAPSPCDATYVYDGNIIRCGQRPGHLGEHADHDGWLSWSPDGTITGGTLIYGDPDGDDYAGEDERTLFWMGWSRMFIAWGIGLICALIVLPMVPSGWPSTAAVAGVAGAVGVMVMLVWDAVRFNRDNRHGR